MPNLVPEFISVLRDIRDIKYPDIVTKHGVVVAKEALMNPHYTNIDAVGASITSVNTNATNIASINTNATNITAIQGASANAVSALASKNACDADVVLTHADVTLTHADVVTTTAKAVIAQKVLDMTTSTATLVSGSPATSSYNATTGVMAFGIPTGPKGDKGDSFTVNAVGLAVDRSIYDTRLKGFSFLAIDTALIYFKLSDTSGDWSIGASFGVGDKGDIGVGISTVVKTSTVGLVDTYTITYTNATTSTFNVTNGANTDHGILIGLGDDDHTQYHNDTRGDARYYTKTANDLLLSAKQDTLVSGTNIKTINGGSILGAGDIGISIMDNIVKGINFREILSSSTFTAPANGKYTIIAVGAGGSGGMIGNATSNIYATGGGAGGICIHEVNLTASDTLTVTIGAGGSGVYDIAGSNGTAGGATTVVGTDISLTANGGGGGSFSTTVSATNGGSGGTASGGNISNYTGGRGGNITANSLGNIATGGGGVPLASWAVTNGGDVECPTNTSTNRECTGGGGSFYSGGSLSNVTSEYVTTGGMLHKDGSATTAITTVRFWGYGTGAVAELFYGMKSNTFMVTGGSSSITYNTIASLGEGGGGVTNTDTYGQTSEAYTMSGYCMAGLFGGFGGLSRIGSTTSSAILDFKHIGGGSGGAVKATTSYWIASATAGHGAVYIKWEVA